MASQAQSYWDANANGFAFSHPIELTWLADLPKNARILDYGCGYGRTLAELGEAGWRNSLGVDFSVEMIARGRREHPQVELRHVGRLPVDEPDGGFDAALLFAALTTIVETAVQDAVMAELARLLRPGGLLYLSDYRLQSDDRYLARYRQGQAIYSDYGVWRRDDGGVFRHHTVQRLAALMAGFEVIAEHDVETRTLSGAAATATQWLGRRR